MKKILLTLVLVLGITFLVGCGKKEDNTVDITYTHGKGTITLSVPKDKEGNPKYKFTTEKPKGLNILKTFYLETDNAILAFSTSGMSYNTSKQYKDKYGDKKATFDGYLEFIEDKDLFNKNYLPGLEQFEINNRKALRYYRREGASGNYKYSGYFYMIESDEIYPGSKFEIVASYKDEELPKESKELDEETLNIINSLKIESNTK